MALMGYGDAVPHIFLRPKTIDIRIQEFIGNGRRGPGTGFKWTRRDIRPDELLALDRVTSAAALQVQEYNNRTDDFDDVVVHEFDFQDSSLPDHDFREVAEKYIEQAEEALHYAVNELEHRKKEVKLAAKYRKMEI
jgi:hypothetical protein